MQRRNAGGRVLRLEFPHQTGERAAPGLSHSGPILNRLCELGHSGTNGRPWCDEWGHSGTNGRVRRDEWGDSGTNGRGCNWPARLNWARIRGDKAWVDSLDQIADE